MNTELTILSDAEQVTLIKCETVIKEGFQTFVQVARALVMVRDQKLYRVEFSSFEKYCKAKWGYTRFYVSRLIKAANIVYTLPIGNKDNISESVIRPLAKIKNPLERQKVWQRATENGCTPTAKDVLQIANELQRDNVEEIKEKKPLRRERTPKISTSTAATYAKSAIHQLSLVKNNDPELVSEFLKVREYIDLRIKV